MTFEEFKGLNKIYRVVADRNDEFEVLDKESIFIPCYNNQGMIYWVDNKHVAIQMFCSPNGVLEREKLDLEVFGELCEYHILVDLDKYDFYEIARAFKAKPQNEQPVPPMSKRNDTLWLRVMRNISDRYGRILKKYIEKGRN